jgi:CBS domain containing-hemolysin-like protein
MLSNALLGSIGIKTKNEPLVSEQELKLVLGGAAKSGALDTEERDMVEDVLELKSTELRWVMTPLVDVVAIEANASLEELRKMWVETTFTRIPVYEDRVDNVVGIVYVMDLLEYTERSEREEKSVSTLLPAHKPWIVPENMSTWNFLKEIRTRNSHMAVSGLLKKLSSQITRAIVIEASNQLISCVSGGRQ